MSSIPEANGENRDPTGEILFRAHAALAGGSISWQRRKVIRLSLITPEDDAMLAAGGLAALRQARLLRLCCQAVAQGARLTYEDLTRLLCTSTSTLKRDVKTLQQQGFAVPLYRRRGRRRGLFLLLVLTFLCQSRPVQAQLSSLFGEVGLSYEYTQRQQSGQGEREQTFRHQYNLGIDGKIFDPRLAAFTLSGTFDAAHFGRSVGIGYAFAGDLALLQGLPYSLFLRHARSFGEGGKSISSSANLSLNLPRLPRLSLLFEREHRERGGIAPTGTTRTRGTLRFSQDYRRGHTEGEVGVENLEDDIRGTSQERFFSRTSHLIRLSPATSFRATSNGFLQEDRVISRVSFSLLNRPNPTLRRRLALGYRLNRSARQTVHTMDLSGDLSKTFTPLPGLSYDLFTSLSAIERSNRGVIPDLSWSAGENFTVSYFKPVLGLVDYRLSLDYAKENDVPYTITHNATLQLLSQTLDPWRLAARYAFTLQDGPADTTSHFATLTAGVSLASSLFLGFFANFESQISRASEPSGGDTKRRLVDTGIDASYFHQLFFNLNISLAISLSRTQALSSTSTSSTIARASASLQYLLPRLGLARPSLDFRGVWRYSGFRGSNYEIAGRLGYPVGGSRLEAEFRLHNGKLDESSRLFIRFVRPFRRVF